MPGAVTVNQKFKNPTLAKNASLGHPADFSGLASTNVGATAFTSILHIVANFQKGFFKESP